MTLPFEMLTEYTKRKISSSKMSSMTNRQTRLPNDKKLRAAAANNFERLPVTVTELPRMYLMDGEIQQEKINHKFCTEWRLAGGLLLRRVYFCGKSSPVVHQYYQLDEDLYCRRIDGCPKIMVVRLVDDCPSN